MIKCSKCGKEVETVCSNCWSCKNCGDEFCKNHMQRTINGSIHSDPKTKSKK